MLFKLTRSVPANTKELTPDWQKLVVARGTLVQWFLLMPEEAADLLHVRAEYHQTQIIPFSGSTWLHGLFMPIVMTESIDIKVSPYVFDIYAYNEDDTYPHEYNVHVNIIPEKTVKPGVVSSDAIARWEALFGGS